jgi:dihydroorotase
LPVTSEVTPHHLSFDQTRLGDLDPNFKMYPPLRETSDRVALVEALRTGIIDVVATDHAPHRADEKEVGFEAAPRGVIGLETAAAATWMALSDRDRLFSALSTEPARLLGLADHGRPVEAGVMANLVVFDPQAPWVVDSFSSKSANSPYLGQEMTGRVRATVFEGMVVHSREKEPV